MLYCRGALAGWGFACSKESVLSSFELARDVYAPLHAFFAGI